MKHITISEFQKGLRGKHWLLFALFLLVVIFLLWKNTSSSREMTVDPSDILNPQSIVLATPSDSTLSSDEEKDILWVREEEKLARDVYQTLYDRWQVPIFSNIAQSESTHMATMGLLIEKYHLADPVKDDARGSFSNPEFQTLYQDLVAKGNTSLEAALTVGATIEDLDIRDIEEALKRTDKQDTRNAYANLSRGSRNHMRAFNRQLTQKAGQPYSAQYISQAQLDTILSQSQETGNGGGQGRNSHQ